MNLTKKEVNAKIRKARADGDTELVSMLEDYFHLKYHQITQIKSRFLQPDAGGLFTPHRCGLREDVVKEWAKKYKII